MLSIHSLSIKRFRSIHDLELEPDDLTVIVGDNDCGKSNILRALNLFFNGETNPDVKFNFDSDFNRFIETPEKTAPQIEVAVELDLPESYHETNGQRLWWRKVWRRGGLYKEEYDGQRLRKKKRGDGLTHDSWVEIPDRSRLHTLIDRIHYEYVPAVRSASYFSELRGRIFAAIAKGSEVEVRDSSGQLEEVIGGAVASLIKDIDAEMVDQSKLSIPNDLTPLFKSLDFLSGEQLISLDNRGDGIKARYIPLILKFIAEQNRPQRGIQPTFIWGYEEPENNLEFVRAAELAKTLSKLAGDEISQLFVTTHSPIFYNMHCDDDLENCTAYHARYESDMAGTKVDLSEDAPTAMDERMGAMAVVAPHISKAQKELEEATEQYNDLKAQLDRANSENLPTLFVEGQTEYRLFDKLIERFRKAQYKRIFLAKPPQRAGANYVTNMLRSWEYRTKHLPLPKRSMAVGVLDKDSEGESACNRFDKEIKNPKYSQGVILEHPRHLQAAYDAGVKIPITLEELSPPDVWQYAHEQKWLVNRNQNAVGYSDAFTMRQRSEDLRPSEMIEEAWRIYHDSKAASPEDNGDDQPGVKAEWVEYLIELDDKKLEQACAEHLRLIDKALTILKV